MNNDRGSWRKSAEVTISTLHQVTDMASQTVQEEFNHG